MGLEQLDIFREEDVDLSWSSCFATVTMVAWRMA